MQFSHSGTMLASASKDTTALIWRVDSLGEPMLMHTLAGHEKAVAFLTWSPDDTRILTCGADNEVNISSDWVQVCLLKTSHTNVYSGAGKTRLLQL